ncbi:type II toxin-antitoxin system Phd/YefM family antitoxin [Halomonas ramblicola]|uniref:type II toxin-antitoxin system Phd/YefM family antitoxin n=1 Tax=Halomonas ramblicola TaxID=747349 RepID=UPI0025B3062E|nr:type II toxin-antitoxin system Phd/YefM family antitoxin [Halomonas ramblicola]MDN3523073.1 type II toxin-antitoxin system Phd/YefM family antitoxin [Halomonas ramblicola]
MDLEVITLAKARDKLKQLCDKVCDRHQPIVITRRNGPHAVLMSLEDYHRLTGEATPSADHLESLYIDLEREEDA